MTNKLSLFVIFAVFVCIAAAELTKCPKVSARIENSKVTASWEGFIPFDVVSFEWGVVSEKKGELQANICKESPFFAGKSDVLDWTFVRKSTQVQSQYLELQAGEQYQVVLRITSRGGRQYWVASAPLTAPETVQHESTKTVSRKEKRSSGDCPTCTDNQPCAGTCSIDIQNRVRAYQETVAEKLNKIYGPALFLLNADSVYTAVGTI